jgi:hypothetical protein
MESEIGCDKRIADALTDFYQTVKNLSAEELQRAVAEERQV